MGRHAAAAANRWQGKSTGNVCGGGEAACGRSVAHWAGGCADGGSCTGSGASDRALDGAARESRSLAALGMTNLFRRSRPPRLPLTAWLIYRKEFHADLLW